MSSRFFTTLDVFADGLSGHPRIGSLHVAAEGESYPNFGAGRVPKEGVPRRSASSNKCLVFQYDKTWLKDGFEIGSDLPLTEQPVALSENAPLFHCLAERALSPWSTAILEDALSITEGKAHPPKLPESEVFELAAGVTPELWTSMPAKLRAALLLPNRAQHAGGLSVCCEGAPLGMTAKLPSASVKLDALLYAVQAIDSPKRKRNAAASPQSVLAPALILPGRRTCLSVLHGKSAAALTTVLPADAVDAPLWRAVALTLAERCGIDVMPFSLIDRPDGRVLAVNRFDRRTADEHSALAMTPALTLSGAALLRPLRDRLGTPAPASYLGLADILNREGADPKRDLVRLWKRMVFAALLGIAESPKRWQFVREDDPRHSWHAGWRLARAHVFAVDEAAAGSGTMLSADGRRPLASVEDCVPLARYFGLSTSDAKTHIFAMRKAVRDWRDLAQSLGASGQEMNLMRSVFERE